MRVKCEEKELSLAEELRWAMEASGRFRVTKRHPKTCPSWGAWYAYDLSQSEPDKFLGRVAQMARLPDGVSKDRDDIRKDSQRTIKELNRMLDILEEESNEDNSLQLSVQ